MLAQMLVQSKPFQALSDEQQQIYARLAHIFQENPTYMFASPDELAETGIGNRMQWTQFLNFEPVQAYIKAQMAMRAQVASRKAFTALETEANSGNVQAVKEINQLSGILAGADQNRTIILHQIQRPEGGPTHENV